MKPVLKILPLPKSAVGVPLATQAQAKFKEGLALQNQGQLAQAAILYRQALQLQPRYFDALHMLGVLAGQTDHPAESVVWIGRAIEVNPKVASAHANLGNALSALQQYQAAVASYDEAIKLNPNHINAHANRGKALYALSQHQAAIASFDQAIALKPDHADAYCDRGLALNDAKEPQLAIASFEHAIALNPNHALAYCNRGAALFVLNQFQEAVDSYDKALAIDPNYADAHFNRGVALTQLHQHLQAVESFDKVISIQPENAGAHTNRGNALYFLKQLKLAIESYDRAIAIKPDHAVAYFNRGIALYRLRQLKAAISNYDMAVTIQPDYADAHTHCGVALFDLSEYKASVESFDKAITLRPDDADAHAGRASALASLKQYEAAVASHDKAIAINPAQKFAYGARLNAKMLTCDWRNLDSEIAKLVQRIGHRELASLPFPVLSMTSTLPLQRMAAEIYVNEIHPARPELGNIAKLQGDRKVRLGYFSADFHSHATTYLMAELFELHDRTRFELVAFSFGPDSTGEMRQRIRSAFDQFLDVQNQSDLEVAELSRNLGIDIAIDLKGFTQDSRADIFAYRAAPIQVNYLGYPGTMGADYMDYLVADRTLVPEESQQHYAEKIAYLPHSYQVNDTHRQISDQIFTRQELGLPPSGFVYCCFNNNYKITPDTFSSWMRILSRVEGSVLWLFEDNPVAAKNLRQEAHQRGVDPQRLVFAQRMPLPDHLARHRAADLFLDTLPYNAHTTASDALWAGLPVLTCMGEAFASRVAASLLTAVGLPELITETQTQYEALAVDLATHPDRLGHIKQKLEINRLSTPLFDTQLFTQNIESAYKQMIARYHAGLEPDHIEV